MLTDPQLSGDDRVLGNKQVKVLVPGAETDSVVKLKLSKDLPPGIYYVGAVADAKDKVGESDETNNLAVSEPIVVIGEL